MHLLIVVGCLVERAGNAEMYVRARITSSSVFSPIMFWIIASTHIPCVICFTALYLLTAQRATHS